MFLIGILVIAALQHDSPSPIQSLVTVVDEPTPDLADSITLQPPNTYTIIYLVTSDGFEPRGFTSPDGMLVELTAAHVAQNAEELRSLRESITIHAIDAVIVHESAYEWVDREWTSTLAQTGTPIAVINMYMPEMAELIDDDCMRQLAAEDERFKRFGSDDTGADHFYIHSAMHIPNRPPTEEELAQPCEIKKGPVFMPGGGHAFERDSMYWLTDEAELKIFVLNLQGHIEGAREFRQFGVNLALTPQSTPWFLAGQDD